MFSVFKNLFNAEELNFLSIKNYILVYFGAQKKGLHGAVIHFAEAKVVILERLYEEWKLAPPGYRSEEKIVHRGVDGINSVTEARGLEVVIAPGRLIAWCKETNFTRSQLEPLLHTFVSEGLLKSFEFFEGQWGEYDEPETGLATHFDPDFETKYAPYQKKLIDPDASHQLLESR